MNVELGKCPLKKDDENPQEEDEGLGEDDPTCDFHKNDASFGSVRSGSVYFGAHDVDTKHKPFILTNSDDDMEKVVSKMLDEWCVVLPRIVLSVVTGSEASSEKNRKLKSNFMRGLITSLNTTEMWLCLDGLCHGFSRDIGLAYESEIKRRNLLLDSTDEITTTPFPETAVIGLCMQDSVKCSYKFDPEGNVPVEHNREDEKRNLNWNFDYFIITQESTKGTKEFHDFVTQFAVHLKDKVRIKRKTETGKYNVRLCEIPVMAVVFGGELYKIDMIRGLLKKRVPVVVIEDTGGAADLLTFVYSQVFYHPEQVNIAEFEEVVLKRQLIDKIHGQYSNLFQYDLTDTKLCEQLFDCIRYSKLGDQEFITLLTLRDLESKRLPALLLSALFRSMPKKENINQEYTKKHLLLAIDWNCPEVAKSEAFESDISSKFEVDSETFLRALVKPNREEFIGLFLSRGFKVHKFLDGNTLLELFQESAHEEFFRCIIWESVLGFGSIVAISRHFVDGKLTSLIEDFTGVSHLISTYELDRYYANIYDNSTPQAAERRAVIALSLWAVFTNRVELVKNIIKYSEQPVHLAMICSSILKQLRKYVTDYSLQNEMKKYTAEFSKMATGVTSMCFKTAPERTIGLLREENHLWSQRTLLEIAAFAKNRVFISQECCQKYIDRVFMGKIKIRDLSFGDMTIPSWLKIIITSFFLFPAHFWIELDFPPDEKTEKLSSGQTFQGAELSPFSSFELRASLSSEGLKFKNFNIMQKWYYFYNAPVTKFWIRQVFYFAYLLIFSFAVIWPACGCLYVDFITCVLAFIGAVDSITHIFTIKRKYKCFNLFPKLMRAFLKLIFVIFYLTSRVLYPNTFISAYNAKAILSFGLLFSYYSLIFMAFPASPELGPMLNRIKQITLVDFYGFMKVTILVIISNAIVMHAITYPDHTFDGISVRRVFFNGVVAFFLIPADYLLTDTSRCLRLNRHPNGYGLIGLENTCRVGHFFDPTCANPGIWPYIFTIQYLVVLRLILLTLLFSIFNNTHAKLDEVGTFIWKYQRYALTIDYHLRSAFPPPLNIISFFSWLFSYCCLNKGKGHVTKKLDETDYQFWKKAIANYINYQADSSEDNNIPERRMEKVSFLVDDSYSQRISIRELIGQMSDLRIAVKEDNSQITNLQISRRERLEARNVPQILSRMSPYPLTIISRFPVPDKRVPWQCAWRGYDPIAYTVRLWDYQADLEPHVDIDIQRTKMGGEGFDMPVFTWNVSSISPVGMFLDRKSWIIDSSGYPIIYDLDMEGLPINPMGRTGMRGKGMLPRWGPNHFIFVVITKWHEVRRYLSAVLLTGGQFNEVVSLPGGYITEEIPYSTIQALFRCTERWFSEVDMIKYFESLAMPKAAPDSDDSSTPRESSSLGGGTPSPGVDIGTKGRPSPDNESGQPLKRRLTAERESRSYTYDAENTDQASSEAEMPSAPDFDDSSSPTESSSLGRATLSPSDIGVEGGPSPDNESGQPLEGRLAAEQESRTYTEDAENIDQTSSESETPNAAPDFDDSSSPTESSSLRGSTPSSSIDFGTEVGPSPDVGSTPSLDERLAAEQDSRSYTDDAENTDQASSEAEIPGAATDFDDSSSPTESSSLGGSTPSPSVDIGTEGGPSPYDESNQPLEEKLLVEEKSRSYTDDAENTDQTSSEVEMPSAAPDFNDSSSPTESSSLGGATPSPSVDIGTEGGPSPGDESNQQLDERVFVERVCKGYMDDAKNTDQAWSEAEVWHVHYDVHVEIENSFKVPAQWVKLDEYVLDKLEVGQASFLLAVAKKMKAALERV